MGSPNITTNQTIILHAAYNDEFSSFKFIKPEFEVNLLEIQTTFIPYCCSKFISIDTKFKLLCLKGGPKLRPKPLWILNLHQASGTQACMAQHGMPGHALRPPSLSQE